MGNTCCRSGDDEDTEVNTGSTKKPKRDSTKKKKNGERQSRKSTKGKGRGRKQSSAVEEDHDASRVSTKEDLRIAKDVFVLAKDTKFNDDYTMKETLGEGAFGVVGKCENKSNGAIRAVKRLKKTNLTKKDLEEMANEIKIVKEWDHPNIVKVYEEYEDSKYLYIVTELLEGGELFDELIRRRKFTEKDCGKIMRQLLEALSYCHSQNIVHKDLKPENILLAKKKKIDTVKLIDFGTAQRFDRKKKMNHIIGTPYYVAPEVLEGSYDEKWDIWGAGVIMFILLSGTPPFGGKDDDAIMAAVRKGKYEYAKSRWRHISTQAKDLIDKMLVLDPEQRMSAKDCLDHEWFSLVEDHKFEPKKLSGALDDLKTFKTKQKMQQAALSYIVTHLVTKEETKDLDEVFRQMDTNHDGKLSLDELIQGCNKVYPEMTEEEAKILFKEADFDHNGTIDYSEWITATVNKKKLLTEDNLTKAFNAFDENGDGNISGDEIRRILGQGKKINERVWKELIDEVDTNNDGQIDFDEFKAMMQKLIEEE